MRESAMLRALVVWKERAHRRRVLAARHQTVANRHRMDCLRWLLLSWEEATRRSMAQTLCDLRAELERGAEAAEASQCRRAREEDVLAEEAHTREQILAEIRLKREESELLRGECLAMRSRNAESLERLQQERWKCAAIYREAEAVRSEQDRRKSELDADHADMEAQLLEALEVQSVCRFALLQRQADCRAARGAWHFREDAAERLQRSLLAAQREQSCSEAALEDQLVRLAEECEQVALEHQRLQREAGAAAFTWRMQDLELQRWPSFYPDLCGTVA